MGTVVIHDFEVVSEKPKEETAKAETGVASPPPSSTPQDIERVVRRSEERVARVHAH